MAPPAAMHKTTVLRIDDQHHTLSTATASHASLRPNADSLHAAEASLHHYHHPNAHITTEVPLHHHAKLNAATLIAGAVHMAKGWPSVPLLHHQHPVQAIDIEKDCDDVLVSEIRQVTLPRMINRSSIPIHRIDNPTSRQVTFSKRRNGLLKKAYELSVLCDAEVGVIIFSGTGRLYEFASTSMPKILERYQECSEGQSARRNLLQDVEFWRHEALLLRDQIFRQKNLESYLLGENLLPLDLNEIQKVEQNLELALNKIRFQKVQLLQTEVHERCRHEARLREDNDLLKRKLSQVTTLHALRGQIDTLAREQECPSASSTFINHGIDEPLKLQLGLELFPTKPASVSNQVSILN